MKDSEGVCTHYLDACFSSACVCLCKHHLGVCFSNALFLCVNTEVFMSPAFIYVSSVAICVDMVYMYISNASMCLCRH